MNYKEFFYELINYNEFYHKGLKKQANNHIKNVAEKINNLNEENKNEILYNFVKNLCDSEELDFIKKRGNADIPFALKCCVEEWLLKRCLKHNMPELRWYYEIFRNDVKGSENAVEFLQEAYQSSECDEKTVNLLLNSELDFLGWGAHHFPQGCIIDDNARKQSFERCFEIIKNKKADKKLIEELRYYEKLYSSYDKYVSDGRIKNFEEYL